MNNKQLIKYAANRLLQHRVKQALDLSEYKSNLVLPATGAALGGLYSVLTDADRASFVEKLKRVIKNMTIGGTLGASAELGRLGYAQKAHDKITDAARDVKRIIHEKTAAKLPIDASHLVLPGIGAGVSSIATLIGMRKSKDSLKNKLKRLMRNAALGATLGTGAELVRTGTKNLLSPKGEIDGGAIVNSNFVDD